MITKNMPYFITRTEKAGDAPNMYYELYVFKRELSFQSEPVLHQFCCCGHHIRTWDMQFRYPSMTYYAYAFAYELLLSPCSFPFCTLGSNCLFVFMLKVFYVSDVYSLYYKLSCSSCCAFFIS
jgi:hypothetical protein